MLKFSPVEEDAFDIGLEVERDGGGVDEFDAGGITPLALVETPCVAVPEVANIPALGDVDTVPTKVVEELVANNDVGVASAVRLDAGGMIPLAPVGRLTVVASEVAKVPAPEDAGPVPTKVVETFILDKNIALLAAVTFVEGLMVSLPPVDRLRVVPPDMAKVLVLEEFGTVAVSIRVIVTFVAKGETAPAAVVECNDRATSSLSEVIEELVRPPAIVKPPVPVEAEPLKLGIGVTLAGTVVETLVEGGRITFEFSVAIATVAASEVAERLVLAVFEPLGMKV